MLRALPAAFALILATPAMAGPTLTPGRQSPPPGPGPVSPRPLEVNFDQRRAIRGCPVERDCHAELMHGLREFEVQNFGSGSGAWMTDAAAPQTRASKPGSKNGRAHLPRWMQTLKLPDVPVRWDSRVVKYLEFYKNDPRGRRIMSAWLKAQGRYRDLMLTKLRRAKLPDALLYISMIESSYDATEYSRSGASGLWQFMPAGGRIYGLAISRWIDERNDPIRSTDAAMLYFKDLYQRFGNWDLALAAYNAGYGAVLRSMAKYNTNDFWTLLSYENGLPWESGVYVPKFLAAAIVGENRAAFGFDKLSEKTPLSYEHVTVPASTNLGTIARAAGTQRKTIEQLNPQLRRGRTPPRTKNYVVRIPGGTKARFAASYAQLRGDWDSHDAYLVSHGERFEDIATMHGISRRKLRKLNDIKTEKEIRGGMILVVPKVDAQTKRANLAKARDDLYASGVPKGKPGDKLIVAVPNPRATIRGKKRVFYRVVGGNTQFGIAKAFGVSRKDLARWNGLDLEAHLHAQMVLTAWVPKNFRPEKAGIKPLDPRRVQLVKSGSPEHLDLAETRIGRKRVVYTAKKKISFEDIGKKYGLSHRDLARINRMSPFTTLKKGEQILVYEVVDRKASKRAEKQAKKARRARPKRRAPKRKRRKAPAKKKNKKSGEAPSKKATRAAKAPVKKKPATANARPKAKKPASEETGPKPKTVRAPAIATAKAPAKDGPKAESPADGPKAEGASPQ